MASEALARQTLRAFRVDVLDARGLLGTTRLAAIQFGFAAGDRVPPWMMHTTSKFGGIALGAYVGRRLIGYSYSLPGFDGREPFLLACGLAVDPDFESLGVGERLKLAQGEHARRAGYQTVRWTTASVASRQLYLYLTKLGARLVRYHEDFYRHTQDVAFPDEVEVVWDLRAPVRRPSTSEEAATVLITSTEGAAGGLRGLAEVHLDRIGADSHTVEVPWNRHAVSRSPDLVPSWHSGVRLAMQSLLQAGYHGTWVALDRSARRSFVRFDRHESGR